MKVFLTLSLILLSLFANCEPAKIPYSEKDVQLLTDVFEESQKLHEGLLLPTPKLEVVGIQMTVNALSASEHPKIKDWKSQLTETIPKNPNDLELSYDQLSKFAIILSEIKNEVKLPGAYQKFYCPMVERYWVAKDKEVRNPYSPEMRDCGEILQEPH